MIDVSEDVRLFVAITFWIRVERYPAFHQVLRSLRAIGVPTEVVVFTNMLPSIAEHCSRLYGYLNDERFTVIFQQVNFSDKTLDLCWSSRDAIVEYFHDERRFTHALYLEDDINFDSDNLRYFLTYRAPLRRQGLIPSFQRVEVSMSQPACVLLDIVATEKAASDNRLKIGDVVFSETPNPYCACFLLDREMWEEYIASASFDKAASASRTWWGPAERAAMGLCFENVPIGFKARFVVPFVAATRMLHPSCLIMHTTNNYNDKMDTDYAKLAVDRYILDVKSEVGSSL